MYFLFNSFKSLRLHVVYSLVNLRRSNLDVNTPPKYLMVKA